MAPDLPRKEYYSIYDFNSVDGFFILDNSAFNRPCQEGGLVGDMAEAVRRIKYPEEYYGMDSLAEDEQRRVNQPYNRWCGRRNIESLNSIDESSEEDEKNGVSGYISKRFKEEARYIDDIVHNIRYFEDCLTLPEIVTELEDYYLKISRIIKESLDLEILPYGGPQDALLSSVANAICSCRAFAVPRALELKKRHKRRYTSHFNWFNSENGKVIQDSGDLEEVADTTNDNKLLALAMTAAHERQAILLTRDVKHIGKSARDYFNASAVSSSKTHSPKLPLNRVRVFEGFPEGWKLWADSPNNEYRK